MTEEHTFPSLVGPPELARGPSHALPPHAPSCAGRDHGATLDSGPSFARPYTVRSQSLWGHWAFAAAPHRSPHGTLRGPQATLYLVLGHSQVLVLSAHSMAYHVLGTESRIFHEVQCPAGVLPDLFPAASLTSSGRLQLMVQVDCRAKSHP